MTVIGAKSDYWGKDTSLPSEGYTHYLRDLEITALVKRSMVVLTTAATGAGIGAIAGASVGGIGAVPGAGIGAGVGAVVGIFACTIFDISLYMEFRSTLTREARESLDVLLMEKGTCSEDDICPLTRCVPAVPVVVGNHKQVFERAAIEEWERRKGTHPLTIEPFSKSDIKISFGRIAKTGKLCDSLLNDPTEMSKLSPVQRKGLVLLREETLERTNQMYGTKVEALLNEVKHRRISPREMADEAAALAEILDPIIGDEANQVRVKIDANSIKIPESAFEEKNEPPKTMFPIA